MADMIDKLYEEKIASAKAGNKESSLWLIKEFCSTIKNNRQKNGTLHVKPSGIHTKFHEGMLDYFRACFEDILEGSAADIALGLNKGKSGANTISRELILQRDCEWCLQVIKLHNSGKYPLLKNAKEQAARNFNVSVSAIEKAWKNKVSKYSALSTLELSKEGK